MWEDLKTPPMSSHVVFASPLGLRNASEPIHQRRTVAFYCRTYSELSNLVHDGTLKPHLWLAASLGGLGCGSKTAKEQHQGAG